MTQQNPAAPSPITNPTDARRLAEGLMSVMTSLLAIVERETALVREGDIRAAMALETEKFDLSSQYVNAITRVKNNQDYMVKTTPDLLAALRKHHDVFRAMLQINLTVLATAHAVSEGIVRGVNGEMQRKNMPNGYTAAGQRATPGPRAVTPLSVSRSL